MTVAITWSSTEGGSSIAESLTGGGTGVDHGSAAASSNTTERELWIRHDGDNQITNAGFYLDEFSGAYGGAASPANDLTELLAWGDLTDSSWGGVMIHLNGGTAGTGDWPDYTTKTKSYSNNFRTGVGDSSANKILLQTSMGAAVTGTGILAPSNTDCQFFMRVNVAGGETTGIRQFDQVLHYTYTS